MLDSSTFFPTMAWVVWRPAAGTWLLTALLLLGVFAVRHSWRLLSVRCGRWRGGVLTGLRAAVVVAVLLALLDPACERRVERHEARSVSLVVDVSASMGVPDRGPSAGTRLARALALAERLEAAVPAGLQVMRFGADTALRPVERWEELAAKPLVEDAGTDLAGVLVQAAALPALQDASVVALVTDGGDAPVEPARLPSAPLVVVGVGGDPAAWRDVVVRDVTAPERVEVGSRVKVEAELGAGTAGDAAFAARLGDVPVLLERRDGSRWVPLGSAHADLRKGVAHVAFEVVAETLGDAQWQVRADAVEGELTVLNNRRPFPVNVVREALKVLYYARRLGADLKFLRQELSSDAAVSFNTLVQTAGDRFLLQGEARGWEELAKVSGLPPLAALKRFDVVVVGSFPAAEWTLEETDALRRFVEEGGGLVWVGGEYSFDAAYAASPLAELMPWRTGLAGGFVRAAASVSATAEGMGAPATAGLWELLRAGPNAGSGVSPELQAFNAVGAIKPSAVALLEARWAEGVMPLLAEQPYGRGRIFALASNTTWRWALAGPPLDVFYRKLWRQTVRAACGQGEGAGVLRVRVERDAIRPGERVGLDVDVLDESMPMAVASRLEGPEGIEVVGLEREAAVSGRWRGSFVCRARGRYTLTVQAVRNGAAAETWERVFEVAPRESEGSRLAIDRAEMERLAVRGAGEYLPEDDAALMARWAARLQPHVRTELIPVVSSGPWYLLVVLALMGVEWTVRRRSNLV